MNNTSTIQDLAKEAQGYLITGKRDNGESYLFTKEGSPDWFVNLVYEAHKVDDILPNDYVYRFISEALDALANSTEGCEDDAVYEIEADYYNYELLKWVSSNNVFYSWCDQVINDSGVERGSFMGLLMSAQQEHKHAVAFSVLDSIREQLN